MRIKIEPVDIRIEDNWGFGLVAFLVDKDDFLQDLQSVRQKLSLKKLLNREKVEKQFEEKNQKATTKLFNTSSQEQRELLNRMRIVASTKYDTATIELLEKYRKSNNFHHVIKFAIISGVVTDEDFEGTEPVIWVITPGQGKTEIPIHYPQIAIVVDPETHPDKVKEGFTNFIKNAKSFKRWDQWVLQDTINNIKRDRKWYWRWRNGESYRRIAINDNGGLKYYQEIKKELEKGIRRLGDALWDKYNSELENIEKYRGKVKEAVRQYRERLGVQT